MASDIAALRKWKKLDRASKDLLLKNVFCPKCFTTEIVDYDITASAYGIVIRGKCKQCGREVARLVEEEGFKQPKTKR